MTEQTEKSKSQKLSNKRRAFVEHYLRCWNASEAARLAGYSPRTAGEIGYENLKIPEVVEEINRRLESLQMGTDEILARLTEQGRGSMADFVDTKSATVDLGKAELNGKLHLLKSFSRTIGEKSDTVRIELYDAQAALALLGKARKLFIDRTELTGAGGGPVEIKQADREQATRELTEWQREQLKRLNEQSAGMQTPTA